ncbi:MAG TPA: hypothetical protein VKF32_05110 [Thermoanaerobaculia bacterium]|nr:hypothetical protein [Thermoanaerobaculia bacterium]
MSTVYTHFLSWGRAGRRRHGGATATDIVNPPPQSDVQTQYQNWAAPEITWSDVTGPHTAYFAFWSVTGAPAGPSVSTNAFISVPVGSSDVVVKIWYLPAGGPGTPGGTPGAYIDAFDVNLGDFVDDDFVDVVTHPNLTAAANNDGFVPTASAEDIRSYVSIHSVPFTTWLVAAGAEAVNGRVLTAAQGTSTISFAFFQTPALTQPKFPSKEYSESTWVSYGVMVDAGGPTGRGPVPPWNPFLRELAAGLALADAARLLRRDLRGAALQVAARQVEAAAKDISSSLQDAKFG